MLRIDAIACRHGAVIALRDASLAVGAGELVALVGANGAGKTTLLRAISGLMPLWRGSIALDGERIDGLVPAAIVRRGISHCPEERQLWPQLTVAENLALGAYTRRDAGAVNADLARVHALFPRLAERREQLAGTLSGGEQQMVAIGRALMSRPRLLMLDEPTLGLAPIAIDALMAAIREIHRSGTAVLLVEQNAALALGMADRAYVIEAGVVVREGAGQALLSDAAVQASYLGRPAARRAQPVP
jgi:branched-chain amino acid transport system ATP-binding protein